jgi:uncharacterized protein DUF1236
MKNNRLALITAGALMLGSLGGPAFAQITKPPGPGGDAPVSGAIEQKPLLTSAQRGAIYTQVSKDKSKPAATGFPAVIGADVPPRIELYALPDDALTEVPAVKLYKYTMVEDKVVVVDPTRMRVIDVIGPTSAQ